MSPEDWKVVLDDFHKGKTATLAYLKLKTSYLQRLPWMLMALAHTCEEVAHEFARKIIAAWEDDPRREAHHRITWKFLLLGMLFNNLRFFSDGIPFCQLDVRFQQMVAAFGVPAGVGTIIEEKHARVTFARKRHHLGPVGISLANTFPRMERLWSSEQRDRCLPFQDCWG